MRILVIGGTQFIGRATVEALLARGHEVTLLHRGQTGADLFPGVVRITVDRSQLTPEAFGDGRWDAVLDMVPQLPRDMETTLAALRERIGRYIMCSTGSVYPELKPYPVSEEMPTFACTPEQAADPGMETYGPRKAECERRAATICAKAGIALFVVRPVLVYGPHDYTDRMHFWLEATHRGRVVLPDAGLPISRCIYVHDLADLFVRTAEADASLAGIYNGAATELFSLRDLVTTAAEIIGTRPEIVSASAAQLESWGLKSQFDVPLWLAENGVSEHAITDVSRAQQRLGFRSTPLDETLRATWQAYQANPRIPLKGVVDPDRLWALAHGDA
jgi:2'-hydroxyisoflavone reductase